MTVWTQNIKDGIKLHAKNATTFYIAFSKATQTVKLGITKESIARMDNFNRKRPGGAADFQVLYQIMVGANGLARDFETAAGQIINNHRKFVDYQTLNSKERYCRETFQGVDPHSLPELFGGLAKEYGARFTRVSHRVAPTDAMRSRDYMPSPMTKGLLQPPGDGLKPLAYRIYKELGVLAEIKAYDDKNLRYL